MSLLIWMLMLIFIIIIVYNVYVYYHKQDLVEEFTSQEEGDIQTRVYKI